LFEHKVQLIQQALHALSSKQRPLINQLQLQLIFSAGGIERHCKAGYAVAQFDWPHSQSAESQGSPWLIGIVQQHVEQRIPAQIAL
jgi:hypothetical protein